MEIQFYEKPGCANNTRQKKLLEENGHTVVAHSLLSTCWDNETLRTFFGDLPLSEWFNLSAPRIKSGEISPDDFDEDTALDAMREEPLLIRRPLLEVNGEKACGFDSALVQNLLKPNLDVSHLLSCPRSEHSIKCDEAILS